jgi:hypothetical protein
MDSVGPVDCGDCGALPDFSSLEQAKCESESSLLRGQANDFPILPSLSISPVDRQKRREEKAGSGEGISCHACPQPSPVVYAANSPQAPKAEALQ